MGARHHGFYDQGSLHRSGLRGWSYYGGRADRCPHVRITVTDTNSERIDAWNSDDLPIYEPGLDAVIGRTRGRNLFFSTDVATGIQSADIIFVSVNTPTKIFGEGAGRAADLQYWEKTAREILAYSNCGKIVVEKSTLPVRTAAAMARILNSNGKGQLDRRDVFLGGELSVPNESGEGAPRFQWRAPRSQATFSRRREAFRTKRT